MAINLDRNVIIDINLDDGKIVKPNNASYYNTDSNIAFFYVKLRKTVDGIVEYIKKEEAYKYTVKMKIVKPKSLNVKSINGIMSDDIIDGDRALYKFTIDNSLMNEVGNPFCYISIVYNEQELVTEGFTYSIKQDPLGGYNVVLLNDPDMPLLKSLLEEIKNNVGGIDDKNIRDDKSFSSYKTTQIANNLSSQIKDIASKKADMNDMNLFGINKRFLQDSYGFYSINFFGDSITQGYNSSNHYEKSYMSLLRKSFQKEYSTTNIGFVNVHPTGYYQTLTTSGNWTNTQSYNYLGSQVIQSTQINATITIIPKFPQKYFSICYEQNTANGAFDVYVDDTLKLTVNSAGDLNYCKKTETIELNGVNNIKIVKKDNNKVAISGLWYYDDATKVMINNYSRAGNTLSDMPSHILDVACDCNILFMALNHNDSNSNIETYTNKINYIRDKVKANKVFTLFLDFRWTEKTGVIKDEIKRVYNEMITQKYPCVYLDVGAEMWQNELYYMQKYGFLLNGDNSHPTDLGHRIIAQTLCKILCIQFQEEYSSDTDWIIIEDLLNGWTNTYEQYPARYKLNNGFLCIEYYLVYGTLGQPAFKLPVGFRPRTQCRFVTNIYEENGVIKYSRCEIGMDGNVTLTASKDGNQYGNIVIAL